LPVNKITQNKVLEMLRDKEITLSKGAELLKMPLQDFLELVSENHISVLDYEPDKVEQNLFALKKRFNAVEFQRKVRLVLSEKYNSNREEFLNELKRKYDELPKHKTRSHTKKTLVNKVAS